MTVISEKPSSHRRPLTGKFPVSDLEYHSEDQCDKLHRAVEELGGLRIDKPSQSHTDTSKGPKRKRGILNLIFRLSD